MASPFLWPVLVPSALRAPAPVNLGVSPMVFQRVTFTRLFPPSGNCFGFEADGKRFFDVCAPGRPRIEEGMTVIALLREPNSFGDNGLLGWVDCHDGSIACDSALKHFAWFIACTYFAVMFPLRAYAIIATPVIADWVAFLVAAMFSAFAVMSLYASATTFIINRALVTVRDLLEPYDAACWANTSVERDASPQSGSRPSP